MNMVNSILLLVVITVKNFAHPDSISLWIFRNEEMRCSRLYFNCTKKIRLNNTKGPMKERLLQKGGKICIKVKVLMSDSSLYLTKDIFNVCAIARNSLTTLQYYNTVLLQFRQLSQTFAKAISIQSKQIHGDLQSTLSL